MDRLEALEAQYEALSTQYEALRTQHEVRKDLAQYEWMLDMSENLLVMLKTRCEELRNGVLRAGN